ncbi:MAG: phosphate ABC transporter permease PstA [Gammaproteobacteria bacterium]|nr:phosphate ABC transporter permease PstA [Gammaproteobacteria bacterium]
MTRLKTWFRSGSPWIWLNAGAVSISIVLVVGLLLMIAVRGLGHFWPAALVEMEVSENGQTLTLVGELRDSEQVHGTVLSESGYPGADPAAMYTRLLVKTGNRDLYGSDFRWVMEQDLRNRRYPPQLLAVERREWGVLYGYLAQVRENGQVVASGDGAWQVLQQRSRRALELYQRIRHLEQSDIGAINHQLERLRLKERRRQLDGELDAQTQAYLAAARSDLQSQYQQHMSRQEQLYQQIARDSVVIRTVDGREVEVPLSKVVRSYRPNTMSVFAKIGFYGEKLWEFMADEPREANTEGGIFPAIFGTVMMVIIMTLIVTPFGVIAAIYMREYARQGLLTRIIRIAVNNLAGVPAIVYGVFGLGFFVYFLGGNLDQLFFPEALPAPTIGTPGLLWSAVTLALLTVPVVIVATEEGLSRVPRNIREGSLALGATKAETLWRTVLPMASPAIMTGMILAIARAAGEVAPLMLVGVVKLAPSLPLDGNAPFLHLDRKFMHLGFHIYDVGFQSPNVEAARPLVYATALLLVLVIVVLNLAAISIRNRLREKYRALES